MVCGGGREEEEREILRRIVSGHVGAGKEMPCGPIPLRGYCFLKVGKSASGHLWRKYPITAAEKQTGDK